MNINISGKSNKLSKKESRQILLWAADRLMGERLSKNVEVNLVFKNMKHEPASGYCWPEDFGERYNRIFCIEVNTNKTRRNQIRTLLHEMVHVKQHAKNQLRCGPQVFSRGKYIPTSKWNGSVWRPRSKECDYFDSPWEIEAYGLEESLCHKWDTRNDKTKPWYIGK